MVKRFTNDMNDGRLDNSNRRRGDYTKDSNVTREAKSSADSQTPSGEKLGPSSGDMKSDRRAFHPQRSPFSSASRPEDRAVTSENYGSSRGRQP